MPIWTRPWTEQPQRAVAVNQSLARSPTWAFSPGSGPVVFGARTFAPTNRGAGDFFEPSTYGLSYRAVRAANCGLNFGAVQPIRGMRWTILALALVPPSDSQSVLFSQRFGSSPFNQIDLAVNSDTSLNALNGAVAGVAIAASGSSSSCRTGTSVVGLAAWRVYGLSRESDGGLAVSVDGVNQALAADTVGTGDTLSSTMQTRISNLGDFASDGFGSLGMTNLILIWDGMDLPAALILEYSRLMLAGVPFWAEDRRVLVPMTATSGLPTLSASTFKPGTLTRTGWTARITAS